MSHYIFHLFPSCEDPRGGRKRDDVKNVEYSFFLDTTVRVVFSCSGYLSTFSLEQKVGKIHNWPVDEKFSNESFLWGGQAEMTFLSNNTGLLLP